jgi:hypothetical protein
MTITIVMTFELNFYVLPTEVLLIMAIFFIFDRTVGILFSSKIKVQILCNHGMPLQREYNAN